MLESFRVNYDFWPDGPEFSELVEELRSLSPEFGAGGGITASARDRPVRR
jgi:hypothetical protein